MTIAIAQHKATLAGLFFEDGRERRFPLALLGTASSALQRLFSGTETVENGVRFTDSPVEFDIDESKLLKDLVNEVKVATISEFRTLAELKELLK